MIDRAKGHQICNKKLDEHSQKLANLEADHGINKNDVDTLREQLKALTSSSQQSADAAEERFTELAQKLEELKAGLLAQMAEVMKSQAELMTELSKQPEESPKEELQPPPVPQTVKKAEQEPSKFQRWLEWELQHSVSVEVNKSSPLDEDWALMENVYAQLEWLGESVALRICDYFMAKWITYPDAEGRNVNKFAQFKHKSPLIYLIMDNIAKLREKDARLEKNETKQELKKHFRFLQIFGFNTQNLVIMQKAVSIQLLMDLLLDFQELKRD